MDDWKPVWLQQYAGNDFGWQVEEINGTRTYYRPLGLVEYSFDVDGKHYEGRADLNTLLQLEARHELETEVLRARVKAAWTCLRYRHPLLLAKAIARQHWMRGTANTNTDAYFVIERTSSWQQALTDVEDHVVFLEDYYGDVDSFDFWSHCQNASRVVDADKALAKLFVLPHHDLANGNSQLRFLIVMGHEIVDGLTGYLWCKDFIQLLNKDRAQLREVFEVATQHATLSKHLPPAQEALYPDVPGTKARQRWFWLLTRILRHVRKPLPAGFANPLRRQDASTKPVAWPPKYKTVLGYSRVPPLNSFSLFASIDLPGTKRLHRLCREAKVSVGSGCFALAAILMMEAYEQRQPGVVLADRKPFITGFPVNPRPFFQHPVQPDSLMLAFSDGILLPFLPSSLPLDGRIRLLAKQAHRQLGIYQKRKRPPSTQDRIQDMGSRGAGRLLAIQYLSSLERAEQKLPPHLQRGTNPQGAYPARQNATLQTCGVSSVGRIDGLIGKGMFDLSASGKDFVADFRSHNATVRARDGEFLVGCGGSDVDLWASVTVDATAMDPVWVDWWKKRYESILTVGSEGDQPKL